MRIESVHARELPVPAQELGRILDSLAGPDDKLWPIERWPNDPIGFDRPLGVGARGGHGPIRYTVVAYERGRRIAFRFEPGTGLRGHHRLEVEPAGSGRARMRHVLDIEVEGIYRLLRPLFLAMHDALVEDLLDNAELAATGRLPREARWPRWLRLANRIEVALRPNPDGPRRRGVALDALRNSER
jgi:polyketide cyclase/dehydrase/lipid transport protein